MKVRRFCGFVLGGLSGRVSSEVSSDVCMGEGSQICPGQPVIQTSRGFATATSLTTCSLWPACCKHFGARCCFASDTKIQKLSLVVLPCFATLVTYVCGFMDAMFVSP